MDRNKQYPDEDGTMRPSVPWMVPADDRILEFYQYSGISAPPSVAAYNIDMSETHVKNRISKLTDAGLLKRVNKRKGYYEITELGRKYLEGSVSANQLEN